jgi:hypothetical protein
MFENLFRRNLAEELLRERIIREQDRVILELRARVVALERECREIRFCAYEDCDQEPVFCWHHAEQENGDE